MILVISSHDSYAAKRLKIEALKLGIPLKVVRVEELAQSGFRCNLKLYSCLYIRNPYTDASPVFIPEVIKLADRFIKGGKKVVDNYIASGHLGEGKWEDYVKLQKAGLSIPKTRLLTGQMPIPKIRNFILKWIYGMKGKGTFFVHTTKDIVGIPLTIPRSELMVQEFIKAQYEYKVITVGYKSLPVILRFKIKNSKFRIEFNNHEILKSQSFPQIVQLAQKASRILNRELAKVDILEAKGKYYILEVNRFPGLESFEKLTKYNVTKDFLRYLSPGA
jgi:glutathione synthase/RimK-type ligase-like ATP-grasp enzyme